MKMWFTCGPAYKMNYQCLASLFLPLVLANMLHMTYDPMRLMNILFSIKWTDIIAHQMLVWLGCLYYMHSSININVDLRVCCCVIFSECYVCRLFGWVCIKYRKLDCRKHMHADFEFLSMFEFLRLSFNFDSKLQLFLYATLKRSTIGYWFEDSEIFYTWKRVYRNKNISPFPHELREFRSMETTILHLSIGSFE